MWANCESFAWEKATNDRTSALVPAPFSRFLSQQVAATAGGAEKIISFIFCGLVEDPASTYHLGQPHWSADFHKNYMDWLSGDLKWKIMERSYCGNIDTPVGYLTYCPGEEDYLIDPKLCDEATAFEDVRDERWSRYPAGKTEIYIEFDSETPRNTVMLRMLNSHKDGITPPAKVFLWAADASEDTRYRLAGIAETPVFPNTGHDAFIDYAVFEGLNLSEKYLKLEFTSETEVYIDEIIINPEI
jgi:hypothetical protein